MHETEADGRNNSVAHVASRKERRGRIKDGRVEGLGKERWEEEEKGSELGLIPNRLNAQPKARARIFS